MKTVHQIDELRASIAAWRQAGESIAFVPTMGNLHEGHLSLVAEAKQRADRVVVSLFVNPMQFGPGEDIDNYPRTLEADSSKLQHQVDLLFVPAVETMYPASMDSVTRVEVPGLSDVLCGASRPGHFAGVTTIVAKLFNMVQPDIAIFGQKDFQQLAIIRRMVSDLNMPVEIIGMPTVREADGLAMSSRNGYLDADQRQVAALIYQCLQEAAGRIHNGENDYPALARWVNQRLQAAGFEPDYCEICRQQDLQPAAAGDRALVILVAARLGPARLIDNLVFEL